METEILQKKEIKRVPKLRFEEFDGEWKPKTLQDITKINQGLQIAISERYTEPIEGGSFYITNEFLRAGSNKIFYIKNAPESVKCVEDDLLMTRTGNTGQVVTGVTGAFHNNFFKIKYYDGCSKWYLYYFLTSHKTQHTILKLAGTSTIPDLNHGDFYKIKINIPQFSEQQKIANFLCAGDKKIQQLTRKKELLETYKKGVMQQLFSQQLRFKDEDGNDFPKWEVKRLGELFIINAGGDIKKERVNKVKSDIFKYPIYANSEKNKGLYGFSNAYKVDFDCVTITGRGALGIAHARFEKFYPIVRLLILKPKRESDMIFFENHINGLNIYCESTGVPQLTAPQISTYKISYPCIQEQQKIADFLSGIDIKIEAVSQQITKMQSFKKGLLQQMFV